jgi:membrane dipeptidase
MTSKPYLVVDAHEDLAWNMLTFGRDYTRTVAETRALERKSIAPKHNGHTLLGWDAYQQGRIALVFATLFCAPFRKKEGEWDIFCYKDAEHAHRLYQQQLDAYHQLTDDAPEKFHLIKTKADLDNHLKLWENPVENEQPPVGLVVLMEGAEGVRQVDELPQWWQRGVRLIGPAWSGTRFCGGTGEPGPLTKEGYRLLEAMADFGFILDISHMDMAAAYQALDAYPGRVVASHSNPLALLPGEESNRFLPDRLLEALLERDAVIGIVPYNRFLDTNWRKGMRKELVSVHAIADHIDYICQFAGDARHVGLGSDFDGGFGFSSVPAEINTIADIQQVAPLLSERGYSDEDLAAIFGGNWLAVLQSGLP